MNILYMLDNSDPGHIWDVITIHISVRDNIIGETMADT